MPAPPADEEPVEATASIARSGDEPEPRWPPVSYWMRAFAGILVVYALAQMVVAVSNIMILILVSLILAIGLQPAVRFFTRRGVKRGTSTGLIFLIGLVVIGGFFALITPTIVGQVGQLVEKAPDYLAQAERGSGFVGELNERFDLQQKLTDLSRDLPSTALSLIRSFTSFLFNFLTVLILTAYFTTALPKIQHGVARLLRQESREDFEQILDQSTELVGGYMLGNLVISVIAGVVSFVALVIIGVPYPAALAFWVALADLIPTVGAILGAVVAVAVAAFAGVPTLIATAIFFAIYQQIENYVIAPRVMTKTVELSAAAIIVAVLIGGTLAGFAGALLALPAAAIIKVSVQVLYLHERLEEVAASDRRRPRLRRRAQET